MEEKGISQKYTHLRYTIYIRNSGKFKVKIGQTRNALRLYWGLSASWNRTNKHGII